MDIWDDDMKKGDDALVLKLALYFTKEDLNKYKKWGNR
jgi:hypothetical protein